jgi:acetate kinase
MPSILSINSGSTSIKYKLFDVEKKSLSLSKEGLFENVTDYDDAVKRILRSVGNLPDIAGVVHRVVHGGGLFSEPVVINGKVLEKLESLNFLAPLHNPFNLLGINSMQGFLPDVPQIAVFDTAFYSKLPDVAKYYPIPRELIEKYGIFRYGFHGTSHEYAMHEAAADLKIDVKKINLITCHLGGGWSITVIKKGVTVDTSMGYTPMEGLMMMTRSGDIDPGAIFELLRIASGIGEEEAGESEVINEVKDMLNHDSGIRGISGGVNDYQELLKQVSLGNSKAKLAFDMATYRLVKYIGAYTAILDGKLDALVFTGRIGAGNPMTRNEVMNKLKYLGNIPSLAIEPNEELMMARKALELLRL